MDSTSRETRRRLADELLRPEEGMDLARAALLVAREEYPQLPVEAYLSRLDLLAAEVRDRLDGEDLPLVVLQEAVETLFHRNHFRGNREAYHDPRNSLLSDVLDRGLGIPLTLGILLLEVGWRLGLPLEGVNFPGHFLVRFRGEAISLLVDPFDGGKIRFQDQAAELLARVYGAGIRVQPSFLRTADRRDMMVRLLSNLKSIYMNVGDELRALAVVERLLLLRPGSPLELRDRGFLLARLGREGEAAQVLSAFLELAPEGAEAGRVRGFLDRLQSGREVEGVGEEEGEGTP